MADTLARAKGITKVPGGWIFLAAVGGVYLLVGLNNPSMASEALAAFASMSLRIAPVLALVYGFLLLASLFFKRKWLVSHLARPRGPGGWALAIIFGILSAGPIYAWYPLLGELKKKGLSDSLIATFLYSRALKLPLLPLMIYYFGAVYTMALSICIVLFSVLSGLFMKRIII